MANSYYDATGVLILDRVTPVITTLFGAFKLDASYPGNGRAYIARLAEVSDPQWSDVLDGLVSLAAELDLPAPDEEEVTLPWVLEALAEHFGTSANVDLLNLIECDPFEDSPDLEALLLIASCFNDGHNLAASSSRAAGIAASQGCLSSAAPDASSARNCACSVRPPTRWNSGVTCARRSWPTTSRRLRRGSCCWSST